jgi:hypothetical protein
MFAFATALNYINYHYYQLICMSNQPQTRIYTRKAVFNSINSYLPYLCVKNVLIFSHCVHIIIVINAITNLYLLVE